MNFRQLSAHKRSNPTAGRPRARRARNLYWRASAIWLFVSLITFFMGVVGKSDDPGSPISGRRRIVEARTTSSSDPTELHRQAKFAESTKDYLQAMRLYRRAANANHAAAQNDLGYLLLKGLAGKREPEEAVKWFKEAARQGYPQAQNNLGTCYRDGLGVKEDQTEAAKWFMQAAEQGLPEAQNNLGVRFYRGLGMPKKTSEAIKWFEKAADQGLPDAYINLGICYVEGRGRPKDLTQGYEWFLKAAEKGDADGLLNLGFAHIEGNGVPKDPVRAYLCFNAAVAHGDSYAQQARNKLRESMTAKQLAEAQRRSYQEYSKRNP